MGFMGNVYSQGGIHLTGTPEVFNGKMPRGRRLPIFSDGAGEVRKFYIPLSHTELPKFEDNIPLISHTEFPGSEKYILRHIPSFQN